MSFGQRRRHDQTPYSIARDMSPLRLFTSVVVVLALAAGGAACDPGFPTSEGTPPIDRETFIDTYVALRTEAMRWEGTRVPAAERDRILAEKGVTAEDLRGFIEVHGRNVPYMSLVWAEVESRLLGGEDPEGPELEGPPGDPPRPAEEEGSGLPFPR